MFYRAGPCCKCILPVKCAWSKGFYWVDSFFTGVFCTLHHVTALVFSLCSVGWAPWFLGGTIPRLLAGVLLSVLGVWLPYLRCGPRSDWTHVPVGVHETTIAVTSSHSDCATVCCWLAVNSDWDTLPMFGKLRLCCRSYMCMFDLFILLLIW